jgi:hypothetical protein
LTELVRFGFALTPRMRSFMELRDGLRCLERARQCDQPYAWLLAACDVRTSLLGEHGRKQAVPELVALLASMRTHLTQLVESHPEYRDKILEACDLIEEYIKSMRLGIQDAIDFFCTDALLANYFNALKKQDLLAHKPGLPQSIGVLWSGSHHKDILSDCLHDLHAAVTHLDIMLNDFVGWEKRIATIGSDQITPERGIEYGLLVVGLDAATVQQGINPECSGNRLALRVRFQQWKAGEAACDVEYDLPYYAMMVPIG